MTDDAETVADDTREVIAGDGKERVMGTQKDGTPPARELARVIIVGIPVLIVAWYITQWLLYK